MSTQVDYSTVVEFLAEKGYSPCSRTGMEWKESHHLLDGYIGILGNDIIKRKNALDRLLHGAIPRRRFVGIIWFRNIYGMQRSKLQKETWTLQVYGRENMEALSSVADELAKKLNIHIVAIIGDERVREETFQNDYDNWS